MKRRLALRLSVVIGVVGACLVASLLATSNQASARCPVDPWTPDAPPTLSGSALVGGTLTTSTGTWTSNYTNPTNYFYQWYRDGVAISGATSASYTVTNTDVGTSLNAKVTAVITCALSGTAASDSIDVGDQTGTPTVAVADDTGSEYILDDDGAYHRLPDADTAYQHGVYWCSDVSDWCGAIHYSTATAFPSQTGTEVASCGCEFWVELPSTVVYEFDDEDGEYHSIPDSATATSLGLSPCGSDWCGVHHDSALPAGAGSAMPSVLTANTVDALGATQSTTKAVRVDQIRKFDSPANGARATWVVRDMTSPAYHYFGSHANHTIWVGANGRDPQTTWVEVGTLRGSQNADLVDNWTYYTARGINCSGGCGSYAAVNLTSMLPPSLGTTHTFSAFYDGSSFKVNIDGLTRATWPSVKGPTIEYDVGFEATCAHGCDPYAPDTVNRTFVNKLQSRRARDGKWITSDHGDLRLFGSGSGSGIEWCSQPFSFRDWLNYTGDTSACS